MLNSVESTLVTFNPKSVSPETPIHQLRQIMEEYQVRHLPVVDAARRIVGMVSDHDIATAYYQAAKKGTPAIAKLRNAPLAQIMARQVVTLEQYESPEIALRAMVVQGFHSTPITEDGQLVGMITSTDFLREFSYGEWKGYEEPVSQRMSDAGATIDGDEPLIRALDTAERCNQQFVVVVRNERPLGILSRTALRECFSMQPSIEEEDLAELKRTPACRSVTTLPTLPPEMPLGQAASKMLEHRARALPVIDRRRSLLGILREDDILRAMAERMEE
jgi:CBS domain-containing protein